MPLNPFRDLTDPDEKRREIVWLAISFIVILAAWLAVVLIFGYQPLVLGMGYDELVLVTGLGLLVFCMVLYLAAREREQRQANRRLVSLLRQTAASLDQHLAQLKGLYSTSAELAGSLDREHISRIVVTSLAEALAAPAASLVLLDAKTGRPIYAHHAPTGAALEEAPRPASAGRGGGPEGLATGGGFVADLRKYYGGHPETCPPYSDSQTLICAPLRLNNGLSGVLGARRQEGEGKFSSDDLWLVNTLANMAANALQSAQLHADLRESYLATVRSLVTSLHARDNYTAAHSQRVVSLAVRIAEQMQLPESIIRDLEVFGPLHDVGKMGIRDDILLKTTPLSQEEQALCRQHCAIGERILRPLNPSAEALAMVRSHHESWDGRGYPDGLAGENIPLLARVLRVADCYDAMTSIRPYQPASSEQEVLAHFRQYSGKHYDPAVVEALSAVVQEGTGRDSPRKMPAATAASRARRPKLSGGTHATAHHPPRKTTVTAKDASDGHYEGAT